ncbi:YqjF family protein [Rummeliibacillus sp. SL167]|uniref:YqjF family protein n=1 Tax=Rummeliibacillus sp. SL167 TaxID=2579792 RepID=UPI0011B37962|nr:DUF2071 domain-containing protein [Rummeliibacillus sp. SL167]
MSRLPWVMTQEWHDVCFLHWPIAPEDIRQYVPKELEIDTFDGAAWLSIVYFQMKEMRVRFMPAIPRISSFLELNVRTYVKFKEKSGVYFFNLDVNQVLVAKFAGIGGILPFQYANIYEKRNHNILTFQNRREQDGQTPEILIASVKPTSEPIMKTPLDFWLTERHYLWTKAMGMLIQQYNEHTPWILQRAHGIVHENTMVPFLMCQVQVQQPIVHYAEYKKAFLYLPMKESHAEK